MTAKLVYYTGSSLSVPESMGTPRADQLQGTVLEQLVELSGRVCYDSLGSGRPSKSSEGKEGYHEHIAKVGHGSVLEHGVFYCRFLDHSRISDLLPTFFGRPGVHPLYTDSFVGFTGNLRCISEWASWIPGKLKVLSDVRLIAESFAPEISKYMPSVAGCSTAFSVVAPITPEEIFAQHPGNVWISMYLVGSRGFSHEMVRHGDYSAISQRSTRFVDESESPILMHPDLQKYIQETQDSVLQHALEFNIERNNKTDALLYDSIVEELEAFLLKSGKDKLTARKQARGAARGYLGNGLQTELIFSAYAHQWKNIFKQRCSPFADSEIRVIMEEAREQILNIPNENLLKYMTR